MDDDTGPLTATLGEMAAIALAVNAVGIGKLSKADLDAAWAAAIMWHRGYHEMLGSDVASAMDMFLRRWQRIGRDIGVDMAKHRDGEAN